MQSSGLYLNSEQKSGLITVARIWGVGVDGLQSRAEDFGGWQIVEARECTNMIIIV